MTVTSANYTDPPDENGQSHVCTAVIDGQTMSNIVLAVPTFWSEQVNAWIAAGNTPTPAPAPSAAQTAAMQYAAAVAAGLTVTWTVSATLNGTYALDPTTQFNMTAETVSLVTNSVFTNGQSTRNWPTLSGTFLSFTVAQFKALATAIALYLDQLASAQATAAAGQSTAWPSASVTING